MFKSGAILADAEVEVTERDVSMRESLQLEISVGSKVSDEPVGCLVCMYCNAEVQESEEACSEGEEEYEIGGQQRGSGKKGMVGGGSKGFLMNVVIPSGIS